MRPRPGSEPGPEFEPDGEFGPRAGALAAFAGEFERQRAAPRLEAGPQPEPPVAAAGRAGLREGREQPAGPGRQREAVAEPRVERACVLRSPGRLRRRLLPERPGSARLSAPARRQRERQPAPARLRVEPDRRAQPRSRTPFSECAASQRPRASTETPAAA